jgi:hypothetical protein
LRANRSILNWGAIENDQNDQTGLAEAPNARADAEKTRGA